MNLKKAIEFARTDVWRVRTKDMPRPKAFGVMLIKVGVLTVRGLAQDRWQLRASGLTYYSLLSIVPALAMVFGIAKGFGFETALEKILLDNFEGQEEIILRVVDFANALLENVKGGLMAVIGLAALFWAIFRLLSQIEAAFNETWGIKRGRKLSRQINDYLALMIIFPFFLFISSTANVSISSGVAFVVNKINLLEAFSPVIPYLLSLTPYWILWLLFTYLYIFMPNTKIHFRSGAVAGIIAGTMYQFFQWGYIHFQVGISRYNAIYGSFAALPLFILWLQISWRILLMGAEISAAYQNVEDYEFETERLNVSHSFKRLLALRLAHLIVKGFEEGRRDLTLSRLAHELEAPNYLVNQVVYELVEAGVVSEVNLGNDQEAVFQPARSVDEITISFVIDALEKNGTDAIPLTESESLKALRENLRSLSEAVHNSPANKLLRDF